MMASTQRRARELLFTTARWAEQTVGAITITFTGERSGLTPGCWALEQPLKKDKHGTEPLLEEEETGCHQKKAGSE